MQRTYYSAKDAAAAVPSKISAAFFREKPLSGIASFTEERTIREVMAMSNCSCTPNKSIKCSVTQCSNHCKDDNYCALNAIQIGTHESNPTEVKCTDCESFRL